MDLFLEKLLPVLVGATLGVLLTRYFSHRKERKENTIELLRMYHSEEMMKARCDAWDFLVGKYKENPIPYDEWFLNEKHLGSLNYRDITKVAYFWYQVAAMRKQGLIHAMLAKSLLGYQWDSWKLAFKPLVDASQNSDIKPDWIEIFEDDSMWWIASNEVIANKANSADAKSRAAD